MSKVESVVSQLQAERKQLLNSLSRIDHALKLLRGTEGSGRRSLSAAARAKIAAAQRAINPGGSTNDKIVRSYRAQGLLESRPTL